jgi:hypothetical protein
LLKRQAKKYYSLIYYKKKYYFFAKKAWLITQRNRAAPIFSSSESQLQNKGFPFSEIAYTTHVQLEQLSIGFASNAKLA